MDFSKIKYTYSKPFLVTADLLFNICFSLMSPALTLILTSEINDKTSKFMEIKIFDRYHVHEGLIGLIFLLMAFWLSFLFNFLDAQIIEKNSTRWILTLLKIIMISLIFFGSFFILRDRRDIIELKFLEIKKPKKFENNSKSSSTFMKNMDHNSVPFFKNPKYKIYHIGIIINSFSINAIIHEKDFLPKEIFHLNNDDILFLGLLFLILGSGLIGIDWLRIFKILHPDVYDEIIHFINKKD